MADNKVDDVLADLGEDASSVYYQSTPQKIHNKDQIKHPDLKSRVTVPEDFEVSDIDTKEDELGQKTLDDNNPMKGAKNESVEDAISAVLSGDMSLEDAVSSVQNEA